MKKQAGFTLVEVLVTGLISSIAAGVILAVLFINNAQIREGSGNLKLSQYQNSVSSEIRRRALEADKVLTFAEWTADPGTDPTGAVAMPNVKSVVFMDGGLVTGAFRIHAAGYLEEMDRGVGVAPISFIPFRIGMDTVHLLETESGFNLLAQRNGIEFDFRLRLARGGDVQLIQPQPERILCRNANR